MPPADPAPAPDSHEPAGRVDVPGAAPEWAVKMAVSYAREGSGEVDIANLARLLASVREAALREAADIAAAWWDEGEDPRYAILGLIGQPPNGES